MFNNRFKITSNATQVNIAINRSLKAKKKAVKEVAHRFLIDVKNDAKKNVASNNSIAKGSLINAIEYDKKSMITGVRDDIAPYAPFVEFGTKGKFKLPPGTKGLGSIAASFKGKKEGNINSWLRELEQYVLLKGWGRSNPKRSAFNLLRYLAREGNKPKPFFYTAVFKNKVTLRRRLKSALKRRR